VLGIGYLRTFHSINVPIIDQPLASWWIIIVLAMTIRRLPYALRACIAAIQQVSVMMEEAAENLGATKRRTVWRILIPLMSGGILAVELSATIMLVSRESDAPLAYGIYEFMQSAAGRGPGAALGVIAVLFVGIGTYISHAMIERTKRSRETKSIVSEGVPA